MAYAQTAIFANIPTVYVFCACSPAYFRVGMQTLGGKSISPLETRRTF